MKWTRKKIGKGRIQYYIEIKFGNKWDLVKTETRQTDALHYAKESSKRRYPMRIVRVVRTIVFEDKYE